MSTEQLDLRDDGSGRLLHVTVTKPASRSGYSELGFHDGQFIRVSLSPAEGSSATLHDEHLRVGLHAPPGRRRLADVLVGCDRGTCHGAGACTAGVRSLHHPGVLVVAVPVGAGCVLRFGPAARAAGPLKLGETHRAQAPWEVWASVAHAWLVAGLPVRDLASGPAPV